ncbi:MAG: hypothetical protein N4A62_17150 [Marinisporobacter sp.]|jgi:hypothetical protein|nr:hypothetical protein [Marinisporobacter sp.]
MKCIAQKSPNPVEVSCSNTCDCPSFVTAPDCFISLKKVTCCFIRGLVQCNGNAVEGAIVFAENKINGVFSSITNRKGEYYICVPEPARGIAESYKITCFCCPDCCEDVSCNCGCNR